MQRCERRVHKKEQRDTIIQNWTQDIWSFVSLEMVKNLLISIYSIRINTVKIRDSAPPQIGPLKKVSLSK